MMKRRIFIEQLSKLSIAVGIGITACGEDDDMSLNETVEIDLSQSPFDSLTQAGNWVLHPDQNIILVNVGGEVRAFTSVCTHKQCSRNWVFGADRATCACHSSSFDQDGNVVRGPAQSPLARFTVDQSGNRVTIN